MADLANKPKPLNIALYALFAIGIVSCSTYFPASPNSSLMSVRSDNLVGFTLHFSAISITNVSSAYVKSSRSKYASFLASSDSELNNSNPSSALVGAYQRIGLLQILHSKRSTNFLIQRYFLWYLLCLVALYQQLKSIRQSVE